jgi:phosphate:Na+ symporter
MSIFNVISLMGGLAFFLFGMHIMSASLEKITGGRLETTLKKMTSNPFKSLLLGAGITIAIQSSSAMTVMLVGLVNSGIMQLGQTVGVIMGSNIGTTLTAWILSLAGIESDNVFMQLLKPESFSPVVALIGIILIMGSKSGKKKDVGTIMVGFAILMYGMEVMKDAVSPLADMPEFSHLLTAFTNPLLGVLVGAVFTGIIQSSAASVGILQALSLTGSITYGMAIPVIMGQNIGTCMTALLSSIGVSRSAKRVAAVHVSFNMIGTIFCLVVFYALNAVLDFAFVTEAITPVAIAAVHTLFNVITTILLLPFSSLLEKLACRMVPDRHNDEEEIVLLDNRLLLSPGLAIGQAREYSIQMAELAREALLTATSLMHEYDEDKALQVRQMEKQLDHLEDVLGNFLVKLSSKELTDSDSRLVTEQLHTINDFERIGDHAVNVLEAAEEIHNKGLDFTDTAKAELKNLFDALEEILNLTVESYRKNDSQEASQVEPLEEVIDDLTSEIRDRHVHRLQTGECTIEMGFVLTDLMTNCERVSDHCSNIAICVIQMKDTTFGPHDYLSELKNSAQPAFVQSYMEYQEKYGLREP